MTEEPEGYDREFTTIINRRRYALDSRQTVAT
jgi:hypothetical protein